MGARERDGRTDGAGMKTGGPWLAPAAEGLRGHEVHGLMRRIAGRHGDEDG